MKDFFYYKPSGEIMEWHTGPEECMSWPKKAGLILGVAEPGTFTPTSYVVNGELVERPAMPITLSNNTIKGASSTAKIWIEGEEYECDGTDIELDFAHIGSYDVTVKDWPYLDWSAKIEN